MVNTNTFIEANWHRRNKYIRLPQQWYQSDILWKTLRRMTRTEFIQRQNKREKEKKIGRSMRQITKDCRNMLKKKLEEAEAFNSLIPGNKYMDNNCFYCNQNGHIMKTCPTKIKDDTTHIQNIYVAITEGNKINPTQSKFPLDKNMILCFKCREHGHFANKCPPKKQDQPNVSLKYPEFIHFKTRGIIKGTDKDFKEEFLVEKLEGQRKLLFTYGMGVVVINDKSNGYLNPGGDRCTLEYMFKNQQGQNMDVDKMRKRHNDYLDDYLEDYFDSMDKEKTYREGEMPRRVDDTNTPEVLKWFYNHYLKRPLPGAIPPVIYRVPIYPFDLHKLMDCMGGYLSVHFGQEFGALAEILGLTRSYGEEIRKCDINYLDVFISYYKIVRAPEDPIRGGEDSKSLEDYQWNNGKIGAPIAVEKGKEKLEHFGI
nr:ARID DNA-binding domain-containing protein [Tanacetum cinerariifolium]GEY77083.1 ARID DNA-binding domain-containing protein [Tanacetum cinerariifolium]